jgi:tyrosyl-tRNA synthetase
MLQKHRIFWNSTSDDLKQLDEATFLEFFWWCSSSWNQQNEIETGINIVDILNEKQDFLSPMAKQDVH